MPATFEMDPRGGAARRQSPAGLPQIVQKPSPAVSFNPPDSPVANEAGQGGRQKAAYDVPGESPPERTVGYAPMQAGHEAYSPAESTGSPEARGGRHDDNVFLHDYGSSSTEGPPDAEPYRGPFQPPVDVHGHDVEIEHETPYRQPDDKNMESHVYRTSQDGEPDREIEYDDNPQSDYDETPPEDDHIDIRAEPEDMIAGSRSDAGEPGSLARIMAPYGIAAAFILVAGCVLYFCLSPIFKAVFGSHHAQAPYVDVAAPSVPPQTSFSAPQAQPVFHPPTASSAQLPVLSPSTDFSGAVGAPSPPQPVAQLKQSDPTANPANPALAGQLATLQKQLTDIQTQLSSLQGQLSTQNTKLESVQNNAQLASDKNSASITLLENNVVSLQSTLNTLQQAAKPPQTASLPVPSNDANDNDIDDTDSDEVIPGYDLRGASATAAVVKTPTGLFTFQLGQEIPGAGTATGWKQWRGTWELVTSAGIIRPAATSK
jgi:hypothetical protein